jgi:hypothetical protein
LLSGDPTEPHAFVREEHGGASQQELAELKNRIEAPSLKKEDAAAKQSNSRKKTRRNRVPEPA